MYSPLYNLKTLILFIYIYIRFDVNYMLGFMLASLADQLSKLTVLAT